MIRLPDRSTLVPYSTLIRSYALALPEDGTYTVLVDQEGTWTGAVTAQLIDIPPDASAQLIAGGPAVTLSNTVPGQNIAFTFSGATNQRVSLTLSASPAAHDKLPIRSPDGLTSHVKYENFR